MDKIITDENTIIENLDDRERLVERIDTLDKVKQLLLLPDMSFTSIVGVGSYYEVSPETIRSVYKRHREELINDGVVQINKKDFLERFYNVQPELYKTVALSKSNIRVRFLDEQECTFANRGTLVFNKRSILRIGMLLVESPIAKEIRTQLLNIEEKAEDAIKVTDINAELNMIGNGLSNAFINNDINAFAKLSMELSTFHNRHKDKTIASLSENIAKLEEQLSEKDAFIAKLEESNTLMSNELLYIPDSLICKTALTTMIKRIARNRNFQSEWICWREFYVHLNNKYKINVAFRRYNSGDDKSSPLVNYIYEDEWNQVLGLGAAICHRHNVEIGDILNTIKDVV